MILQSEYCEKCGEKYTNMEYKWCRPCQINHLNWTSGDGKLDNFIQETQIIRCSNRAFEWIPYNQFSDIKEISKDDGLVTVYSAIWKDGPLLNKKKRHWMRVPNKKVRLVCLSNSQNNIDRFLSEV
jgi:hypothetical protein